MGHHYHDLVATFRLRRRDVVRAKFTESNDHEELYNREKPNQHPIEAITDLTETLALKQNLLIDGVNIKTVNGENILGEGNIEIQGGSGNVDDVKVNGTSVVTNKTANIQIKTVNGNSLLGSGNVEITIPTKVSDLINDSNFQTQTQLNTAISNHNDSNSAHSDIRQSIANASQGISNVEELIPNQASSENQLADKNFVNSSVATNTANFIGTFNSISELENYSGTITNNDYAFVISTDQQGNTIYNRYKYNSGSQEWLFEYALNNSSFTANQWAAINSEITANKVTTYDGYGTSKQDTLVSGTNIKTVNGNNLLGSGNVAITTYTAFNPNWHNSSSYTTFDFCESVNADPNAIIGMAYLGSLKCNDIPIAPYGPSQIRQGDATVKIIGQGSTSKIITIELSSSSDYPYKWQITYHSHTIDEPGWIGFQPELPSQTGNNGKFLTTNGSAMSWSNISDALTYNSTTETLEVE